jgi:hypothetical protein
MLTVSIFYYIFDSIGYDRILFPRPELYELLFKQIPKEKIRLAKKVMSFQQNHEGIMLRFSDNTTIHGDILVGADGAHSSVRQHLYKTLEKQGLLPRSDTKHMNKGYISLVGTTDALDPKKYPSLTLPEAENSFIIGDKNTPYTVSNRQVGIMMISYLELFSCVEVIMSLCISFFRYVRSG